MTGHHPELYRSARGCWCHCTCRTWQSMLYTTVTGAHIAFGRHLTDTKQDTPMTLDELIAELEKHDPDKIVPLGFTNPHSYRGDYMDLAFEPARDVRIGDMLTDARSALGTTFQGYKGGDFTMGGYSDCWLAEYGSCGETFGPHFVRLMLAQEAP